MIYRGWCAGLAAQFDVDVLIVRAAFVLIPGSWILYLALWLWLPTGSTADLEVSETP